MKTPCKHNTSTHTHTSRSELACWRAALSSSAQKTARAQHLNQPGHRDRSGPPREWSTEAWIHDLSFRATQTDGATRSNPSRKGRPRSAGDISLNLSSRQTAPASRAGVQIAPTLNYSKTNIYIMFARKLDGNINEFAAWLTIAQIPGQEIKHRLIESEKDWRIFFICHVDRIITSLIFKGSKCYGIERQKNTQQKTNGAFIINE